MLSHLLILHQIQRGSGFLSVEKNCEGYFDNKDLLQQTDRAINIFESKTKGFTMGLSGFKPGVKNGISDLTKMQIDQGQHRIDITNDCQKKALKEAVVKENGLRWMCLQQRRLTPKKT